MSAVEDLPRLFRAWADREMAEAHRINDNARRRGSMYAMGQEMAVAAAYRRCAGVLERELAGDAEPMSSDEIATACAGIIADLRGTKEAAE